MREHEGERPEHLVTPSIRVSYKTGINESTPYFVSVNGARFSQLLQERFDVPERHLGSIGLEVFKDKREDRLAEVASKMGFWGNTLAVRLFMGSFWNEPYSPKYAFLLKGRMFDETRRHIVRTLFHESQHVKDSLYWIEETHHFYQAVKFLAASSALLIASDLLENRRAKTSKVTMTLGAFGIVKAGLHTLAYLLANKEGDSEEGEKSAREAAKSAPIKEWMDLVEFKPNNKRVA